MTTALAPTGPNPDHMPLAQVQPGVGEMTIAQEAAMARAEIESAITIARKFPREPAVCGTELNNACKRPRFAEQAVYAFPRGKSVVKGPSVNLAREAARCWGNIKYGLSIIQDDKGTRKIRGWAWDLQTNTKIESEDSFAKKIQRRTRGQTVYVDADERELRELTNRRGAICVRNCLLQLVPRDIIEEAIDQCEATVQSGIDSDPKTALKKIVAAFDQIGVTADMLAEYLGHPVGQSSPNEIADLRTVWKSISDGNSNFQEYIKPPETEGTTDPTLTDLRAKIREADRLLPSEDAAAALKSVGIESLAQVGTIEDAAKLTAGLNALLALAAKLDGAKEGGAS